MCKGEEREKEKCREKKSSFKRNFFMEKGLIDRYPLRTKRTNQMDGWMDM